jgi:hypothetical protein
MGKWANASAINLMYGDYGNASKVDYWYLEIPSLSLDEAGQYTDFTKHHMLFTWEVRNSIVFQYDTDISPCLWVLDQDDYTNPELYPDVRDVLYLSDFSRIQSEDVRMESGLFGREPAHNWWCCYYQKGDLAVQQEDWQGAVDLWHEAVLNGQNPYRSSEYIPFLEAAGMQEDWELASALTEKAAYLTDSTSQICDMWQGIQGSHPIPEQLQSSLVEQYGCTNLQ